MISYEKIFNKLNNTNVAGRKTILSSVMSHPTTPTPTVTNYIRAVKEIGCLASWELLQSIPRCKLHLKGMVMESKEEETGSEEVEKELPFEVIAAQKWVNKYQNALSRGIEFTMSQAHMRKLLRRKTCHYTGKRFSEEDPLTLERIDSTKGYTNSNTIAVCSSFNVLKNCLFEEGSRDLRRNFKHVLRMMKTLEKMNYKEID